MTNSDKKRPPDAFECLTAIVITVTTLGLVGCDGDSNVVRDEEPFDYDGVEHGMQADAYERAQRIRDQDLKRLTVE